MTRWLSITAAAEYMSASAATVRRYIRSGRLHVYEMDGLRRLDKDEIDGLFVVKERGKIREDLTKTLGRLV